MKLRKLGAHARPFGLRRRLFLKPSSTFVWVDPKTAKKDTPERKRLEAQLNKQKAAFAKLQAAEPVIFNEPVAPGTAIFMTYQANEYMQHAVLPTDAEQTGSIVLRSISTIIAPDDQHIPGALLAPPPHTQPVRPVRREGARLMYAGPQEMRDETGGASSSSGKPSKSKKRGRDDGEGISSSGKKKSKKDGKKKSK